MKNIKYIVVVVTIVFGMLLGSCNEDQFSQIKVIELPEHSPLLSATANLNKDLSIPFIFVSHSKQILDDTDYDIIDDASVKLYKNDELFLDFAWNPSLENYKAASSPEITEGNYKLEISAPNYAPITATQTLPKNCEILDAEIKEDAFIDEWGDPQDVLEIKIKDDASERNYYAASAVATGKNPNGDEINVWLGGYSNDPLMEYGYDKEFLPDETFSGGTYIIRNSIWEDWEQAFQVDQGGEVEKLVVIVESFSEDFYRYDVSRLTYSDSQDVPFIEPVLITTNWENGFGVFSLSNYAEFELEL